MAASPRSSLGAVVANSPIWPVAALFRKIWPHLPSDRISFAGPLD